MPSRHLPPVWAFVLISLLTIVAAGWIAPHWQPAVAQDAAAPAPDADTSTAVRPEESLFMHIVRSAGWVFGPLLLFLSIALVALIVMLSLDLG